MGVEPNSDWQAAAASALEWWRDAGVDVLTEADPRDWLARAPSPAAAAAAATAGANAEAAAPLPETLEAFVAWRMGADAPEAAWHTPRVAPGGPADAALMVLVDMPEAEDAAAGTLLSGAAGRLFDRMLAAIGLEREQVYLAPLAYARPVTEQLPGDAVSRLRELALHHLGLIAPQKLLLLGRATERVLIGTNQASDTKSLHAINHSQATVMAAACHHPRFLLKRPAAKADAWKNLQLLLSGGPSQCV